MRSTIVSLLMALSCTVFASPASASGIPACSTKGSGIVVKASWYGKPFHGRTMANGKTFNMYDASTVAHKSLPFGTKVRLVNQHTGTTLMVVVRDRGPYIKGRTFDLSMAGAQRIGVKGTGVAALKACIVR